MIDLRGRCGQRSLVHPLGRQVWQIAQSSSPRWPRSNSVYLLSNGEAPPTGFDLYLYRAGEVGPVGIDSIELPPLLAYLREGDILWLSEDGEYARVLWRADSRQNSVLLTERCDNYCLMCSQPPKQSDDSWLLENARELVRLLPPATTDIGYTGGEPTIYGYDFVELLRLTKNRLPIANVHILSNGRRFSDTAFAEAYASIDNPNMMVGIPIYGSEESRHDYVVQAEGAFNDTIWGILNLGALGQRIEIRVVVHKQTAFNLPEIAEYIARNLPFVDQVALMGLEVTGFARANLNELWIDPVEYQAELVDAVTRLDRRGIPTLIYNHQLCLLDRSLWEFAVRSISDWKNEFHPECESCAVREQCGGFFASSKYRVSDHISAVSDVSRHQAMPMLDLA